MERVSEEGQEDSTDRRHQSYMGVSCPSKVPIQLPRGPKTYTMAVAQGLCNSGIEVWRDYAPYNFSMQLC